jgi:hypothetical protein
LIEIICYTVCTTWLRLFLHEPNKNCDQSLKMFCWSFFVLLSFFDLRILIAPLVSSSFYCWSFFVLLSFFWFTDSDCPFGIFKLLLLIVLCPSVLFLIYGFWFPLWYLQTFIVDRCLSFYPFLFWSLHCLSSKLRFLITHLAPSRFFFTGSTVHNIFCAQLH